MYAIERRLVVLTVYLFNIAQMSNIIDAMLTACQMATEAKNKKKPCMY